MGRAITPEEIAKHKAKFFPDFVFDAVNDLIAAKFTNGRAQVLQKDILKGIVASANAADTTVDSNMIFSKGWLNFEEVYREAGWKVTYDKPAYNESYEANFIFTRK